MGNGLDSTIQNIQNIVEKIGEGLDFSSFKLTGCEFCHANTDSGIKVGQQIANMVNSSNAAGALASNVGLTDTSRTHDGVTTSAGTEVRISNPQGPTVHL